MRGYSGNPYQCLSSCPFQTTTSSNRRVKQKTHKETHPLYLLRTLNNEAARLIGADTTANSPVTTLLRKAVFRDLKGFTWQALGSGSSVTHTTRYYHVSQEESDIHTPRVLLHVWHRVLRAEIRLAGSSSATHTAVQSQCSSSGL